MQKTTLIGAAVKDMLKANKGRFFTVTFKKKDGSLRTLNCKHGHVKGHDKPNTTAHIEKYLTVVLTEKDAKGNEQFRNVNCEEVVSVSMGGKVINFE